MFCVTDDWLGIVQVVVSAIDSFVEEELERVLSLVSEVRVVLSLVDTLSEVPVIQAARPIIEHKK